MDAQAASKPQAPALTNSKKVMRSYQVVLKCANQSQREEINKRIRELEELQYKLLSPQVKTKAVKLYRTNPKEGFFTRQLCKEVGQSPNFAESAFHWLYIAIKVKIDKEKKVQSLLNFLLKNPQQLVEWLVFVRSPYTERKFRKLLEIKEKIYNQSPNQCKNTSRLLLEKEKKSSLYLQFLTIEFSSSSMYST